MPDQDEIWDLPESAIIVDGRRIAENYYNLRIYTAEQTLRYVYENRLYLGVDDEGPASRWRSFLTGLINDVDAARSQEASC